jgi:hypothetical protein
MTIPVFVEPTAGGFRASTGAPLDVTAEAATEAAALDAVRAAVTAKLAAGGRIVSLPIAPPVDDETDAHMRIIAGGSERVLAAWNRLAANPLLSEWEEATREARRQMEAEDEARERAWAAANGRPDTAAEEAAHP